MRTIGMPGRTYVPGSAYRAATTPVNGALSCVSARSVLSCSTRAARSAARNPAADARAAAAFAAKPTCACSSFETIATSSPPTFTVPTRRDARSFASACSMRAERIRGRGAEASLRDGERVLRGLVVEHRDDHAFAH